MEAFYQDLDQEGEGFLRIDLLEKIMIIFTPRTVIVMEDMINLLSWSNLNLVKVRRQMIRKIMLIREMISNIPKLPLRFHENKNSKLLMQCLMRQITRTLYLKAILLLNAVILKIHQDDMKINKG